MDQQVSTTSITTAPARRTDAPGVSPTLLVCADEHVLAAGQAALAQNGFRTQRANGWAEALSLFGNQRPGAVLVDGAFLDGSGPRLCAALRRMSGRVPVPVLALCDGKRDVLRALEAGASDVVEKPLDWAVVSRRLACLHGEFRATTEATRLRALLNDAHKVMAQALASVEQQALVDPLTGLPSRLRLDQVLQRSLARSRRLEGGVALLTVDLDRFSDVNETLGRPAGDDVLRQVAGRLTSELRSRRVGAGQAPGLMLAARVGGDEFGLMLTEVVGREALSALAQGLLAALSQPFTAGGTEVYLSASLGIAVATADVSDPGELLQHAETAMYEAKRRGGSQFFVYSAALNGAVDLKLGMDRRLRSALEREAFTLQYQPVIEPATRRVLGVEALLRWQDAVHGWISPADFVPVAEETGLMTMIGSWVLRNACRQLKSWIEAGLPPLRMAVNVSRCQLERGDLAAEVERTLAETGLDPGLLELEISERGTLRSEPGIVAQLRKLKTLGVRIVVDDFGTGQSAIAYLKQFPLDALKIDRSFVSGTVNQGDDAVIVSAMVAMAHRLGLGVVAEGVETEAQLGKMREFGCEAIQGFFFSRAVTPADFMTSVGSPRGGASFLRAGSERLGVES